MATHSSLLAWRIPCTEEPGRRWSTRSERVGHDWSDLAHVQKTLDRRFGSDKNQLNRILVKGTKEPLDEGERE